MPARRIDLIDDLRAMGVRPGTCVMVHADGRDGPDHDEVDTSRGDRPPAYQTRG